MNEIAFSDLIRAAEDGVLTEELAESAMERMADGAASAEEIKRFLSTRALSIDGVTAEVLTGLVRVIRRRVVPTPTITWGTRFDIVGTGGGVPTFNVSTASSILLSALPEALGDARLNDLGVAKHGNRAVASKSGAADVLEALGLSITLPPEKNAALLNETRFAFFFAQKYHTAFSHVMPVRRELAKEGKRTAFNLIGPLANPAGATHQVIGFFAKDKIELGAEVLKRLGVATALCVSGETESGAPLDEISPCGRTSAIMMRSGSCERMEFSPEDFGVERSMIAELAAEDAARSAAILTSVLSGSSEHRAARNAVIMNTAAALLCMGGRTPAAAGDAVREALASGAGARQLERITAVSARYAA